MQHPAVLDVIPSHVDSDVRDLLVLWQHPDSRAIMPIGRMTYDGSEYAFAYVRTAQSIEGFRPLLGLPQLDQRYAAGALPPVFAQRVMAASRPDFDDYLRLLELTRADATPWEQIVRSGGVRAGDTIQFMQVPTVTNGTAHARFLANGIRHIPGRRRILDGRAVQISPDEHERALSQVYRGSRLGVCAESENPRDEFATLVTAEGTPVGYVPQLLASGVRQLLTISAALTLSAVRVNGPDSPPHLRLVVDLEAPAPEGFSFDIDGQWEPIGQ